MHRLTAYQRRRAKPSPLSTTAPIQAAILETLALNPLVFIPAAHLRMFALRWSTQTFYSAINALAKVGWVQRKKHLRKQFSVAITSKGLSALQAFS